MTTLVLVELVKSWEARTIPFAGNINMKATLPVVTAVVSKKSKDEVLIQGNDYPVIGIQDNYYYIVDEIGEPILYPKDYFIDCEISPQEGWIFRHYEGGEYRYYPPELDDGTIIDLFWDNDPKGIQLFCDFCKKYGIKEPHQ